MLKCDQNLSTEMKWHINTLPSVLYAIAYKEIQKQLDVW